MNSNPNLEFENVKTKETSLPNRVAEQISQLIIEQQLSAGEKLPNEFDLANRLNVGRGTIREAVKLLVARNVLEIRRGRGTFIARNPGEVDDPLGFAYYPDQFRLALDLLDVRKHLEPWIAQIAALNATEEDIRNLELKCRLVEEDILEKRDHLPHDKEFHLAIAECTQNLVVPRLIPIITYSVTLFGALTSSALRSETIFDHRAILDAIKNHDAEGVCKAMSAHIERNRSALENVRARQQAQAADSHDNETEKINP